MSNLCVRGQEQKTLNYADLLFFSFEMALTREQFNQCIRDFLQQSKLLHDRWQLMEVSKDILYLSYSMIDDKCIKSDFHVLFSDSYSVPVLYFNFSRLDGSLLSLDEVWQLFVHRNHSSIYETITQQEHPILHRPFFLLHPCHTETVLKKVNDQSDMKRFLFWLSIYGQSVGLPIRMEYAQLF